MMISISPAGTEVVSTLAALFIDAVSINDDAVKLCINFQTANAVPAIWLRWQCLLQSSASGNGTAHSQQLQQHGRVGLAAFDGSEINV